jgi:sulfite exporter TauE/SafE
LAPTLDGIALSSLAAAFAAALTGSLHCVGMCGPLRLLAGDSRAKRFGYQLGRGLAYSLLGGAAGAVGWAMPAWALLLLVGSGIAFTFLGGRMPARWQKLRSSLLALASTSPFLFGLSSGLLPCGMLHAWVAAAAATASPLAGALLLASLWLGTLPALELSGWALAKPLAQARRKFPRLVPASFILLALVPFLLRMQPAHTGESSHQAPLECHHGP